MECKFTVGQKVVCVDADRRPDSAGWKGGLTLGEIYTVEMVGIAPNGHVGVVLIEIKSDAWRGGFFHERFRPVRETKTDISLFTEIVRREFDVDKVVKPVREPV